MRNHSFYELSTQAKYQEFNIRASESGLYLSLTDKRLDASSIFEEPEYGLFELEDIHVTALEQYEINRKPVVRGDKSSSPFHITLRFSEPDSGRKIVIHDFYSPLDLSRDFHVQLKEGEVTTYLPAQTINLSKLNQLIEKEMRLVKELIDKNNKHEHDLRRLIDLTYEDLFSRAQQANLLPETIDESEQQHFHQSLVQIIGHLEQLIHLGHHHESRRLEHAHKELAHLMTPASQKAQVAAEEKVLMKASKAPSQKSAAKKGKSQKPKISAQVQLGAFLNTFYAEVQAIKARNKAFLEDINRYMLSGPQFDPKALLVHFNTYLDILIELPNAEIEQVLMDFFEQFSNCQDLEKQIICREIAEFLSLNVPSFANFMTKLSLMTFEFPNVRVSSILVAFFNKNIVYWEFMHSYGMSFADNRHIILGGTAGNILHGILFLIRHILPQSFDTVMPFVQLLFKYLEEDGVKLRNMKTIGVIKTENRKKLSSPSGSRQIKSEAAAEPDDSGKKFVDNIREEPYGTVLIIDAIEAGLDRRTDQPRHGMESEVWFDYLIPLLAELFTVLMPHISTTMLLNTFQRLLDLQVIAMFDERSCQKLRASKDLSALDVLTEFTLVYVGANYKESISRLLDVLIGLLTERLSEMSNSTLSHLMQNYYRQSKADEKSVVKLSMFANEKNNMTIFQVQHKLLFAKIAYFLFTIKAKRGMFLTFEDCRVLLNFFELLFTLENFKLRKDLPDYRYRCREIFSIIEILASSFWGLDLPEAVRAPLFASPEFFGFSAIYDVILQQNDDISAEEPQTGLALNE